MKYFLANAVAFGQAVVTCPSDNDAATNSKEKLLPSYKIVKKFMEKLVDKERDRLKSLL